MELNQLSQDMFRFSVGSDVYLAIATSLKDEVIAGDAAHANASQYGWIVREDSVFPWKHRLACIDDTVHIVGPYLRGVTFRELLADGHASLGHINRLARTLALIQRKQIVLSTIHTRAIVFLNDGGVLLLKDQTVSLLCKYQEAWDTTQNCQPFNHPQSERYGYSDEERYSFALAALTYYALCGQKPWDVENNDELRQHIMSGILPTLHFHDPYIRPEIVQEIHNILGQPKLTPPPLKFWENFFHTYLVHGTHTRLSDNEVRVRVRKAHIMLNRLRQARARAQRIRRHSFRLGGVMLFLLLIAVIPYALTQLTIHRPAYRELSAEGMVRAYYDGIEMLDRRQVAETLHPDYSPPSMTDVDIIYRASRIGMIFRFQNPYIEPELWVKSGRKRIGKRYSIYGIDRLSLTEIARAGDTAQIMATYRHWVPHRFSTDGAITVARGNSTIVTRQERISLRKRNGRWVIAAVEPIAEATQ